MPKKIVRDPLYNYITIDEPWLLELIDAREVQRLRRIHQLGISHVTYPGADHSRLSHTLGVVHLMGEVLGRLEQAHAGPWLEIARAPLLAAAALHDVGHGPFSHLFEPLLKIDHEVWSCKIIGDSTTEVNEILTRNEVPADYLVSLIEKDNRQKPPWQKALLTSELDVDRLDYLRRDSYFTGAGYGHFDWYRILNSVSLAETDHGKVLVWPDTAKYAIEEYVFARSYMYQNVYQHKTTRGFEKVIHAAWRRAEQLESEGIDPSFVETIRDFREAESPTIEQYLALEDATLIYQLTRWTQHSDPVLADLASRVIHRRRMKAIRDPVPEGAFEDVREKWEDALRKAVELKGHSPPEYYALRDDLKQTIYNPYVPEKEKPEQDPYNAILISDGQGATEISEILTRLQAVTGKLPKGYRYYVPEDVVQDARTLAESDSWR